MARLDIQIPDELMQRLNTRLNMKKSTGIQKGDRKNAVIEAIELWMNVPE